VHFRISNDKSLKGEHPMAQDQADKYRCEECGATFESAVEWEHHNRRVHFRYTCEHCREHFDREVEYEEHNFKVHSELEKNQR
jgi:transposase-like protein